MYDREELMDACRAGTCHCLEDEQAQEQEQEQEDVE